MLTTEPRKATIWRPFLVRVAEQLSGYDVQQALGHLVAGLQHLEVCLEPGGSREHLHRFTGDIDPVLGFRDLGCYAAVPLFGHGYPGCLEILAVHIGDVVGRDLHLGVVSFHAAL